MSIGNWKKHILVNCAVCLKPMGYHVTTTAATCNDCERATKTASVRSAASVGIKM
jgi:hypothetical protein